MDCTIYYNQKGTKMCELNSFNCQILESWRVLYSTFLRVTNETPRVSEIASAFNKYMNSGVTYSIILPVKRLPSPLPDRGQR